MLASKIAMAAAGLGGQTYVEDVFSAYTYTGDGSTPTITNGLAMSDGSMVWIKNRDQLDSHVLVDTDRGVGQILSAETTAADTADADTVTAFGSTGFTLGADVKINTSTEKYASWSFLQADNFFFKDEVTKAASTTKTVDLSSLGTVGMVMVKRTDSTGSWYVWHRSLTAGKLLIMETTAAEATLGHISMSGTTLSLVDGVIADGTYIVYAWGHAVAAFGANSDQDIIQCGTFTTSGTPEPNAVVTLGWEPQYFVYKLISGTNNWEILDSFRGLPATTGSAAPYSRPLFPNTNAAESNATKIKPTATGVNVNSGTDAQTWVYMAIRRPMKVPTAGTDVYNAIARSGNNTNPTVVTGVGFTPDLVIVKARTVNTAVAHSCVQDRLRGANTELIATLTNAEGATANSIISFDMDGFTLGDLARYNETGSTYINYFFKRAPKFMDVVCDTGTGSAHTVTHNLAVAPELMIRKKRSAADAWVVYANADPTDYLVLNTTAATVDDDTIWNDTAPTSAVFTVGTHDDVNGNTDTFVTYLFATLAGVSKVGTYTGNGTTQTINCGFTAGARFVLIKRTDSTGNWVVFDSVRGIVAGNDPYSLLNSTAVEDTDEDAVDTDSSGFIVNETTAANANVNTATYIFLAIA